MQRIPVVVPALPSEGLAPLRQVLVLGGTYLTGPLPVLYATQNLSQEGQSCLPPTSNSPRTRQWSTPTTRRPCEVNSPPSASTSTRTSSPPHPITSPGVARTSAPPGSA